MQRTRICDVVLALAVVCGPTFCYGNCPEVRDKATLDSNADTNYLGGSYCRDDSGAHFPVRGIRNTMAFETTNPVCIDLRPSTAKGCGANPGLPNQVSLTVENVGGNNFRATLGSGTSVDLLPYPHGSSVAYWLHGTATINKSEYEVFLYLLDEPQASSDIYKHYRLELFDTSDHLCKDQPVPGTNFWLKSMNHRCDVVPASVYRQTASGDGYEPKK